MTIEELTPSQELQITEYREKWRKIAVSTNKIDRSLATEAIKAAYQLIDKKEPSILFCPSPYDAFKILLSQVETNAGILRESALGNSLGFLFISEFEDIILKQLNSQIAPELIKKIQERIDIELDSDPFSDLKMELTRSIENLTAFLNPVQLDSDPVSDFRMQLDRSIENITALFNPVQLDSDLGILIALELGIKLEEKLFIINFGNSSQFIRQFTKEPILQWLYPAIESYYKLSFLGAINLGIPFNKLYNRIISSIFWQDFARISESMYSLMGAIIIASNAGIAVTNSFVPERWTGYTSYLDYCFSVLNCSCDRTKWETFKNLVANCGWIFPFEKICIVSDRPTQIYFDSANRIHAENNPAIEFNDGFTIWVKNGVRSKPLSY